MKIACWQATPDDAGAAGLRAVARRAAAAGAALLVTPELSATGYLTDAQRLRALAEPPDGPWAGTVSAIAAEAGIAIVHGGPEADGDRVYNTACLVDRTGRTVLRYRKSHLYGPVERAAFSPGEDGVKQVEFGGLTLGMLICYDVEFPEAVRAHAVAGTQLLVVPTALMTPGEFVATGLVPARAFENQLFIAYANWTGEGSGLTYCGLSRIVGPDGRVLSGSGELRYASIDLAEIPKAREFSPYLADRRPALFAG
ncbi:carbon-nitrogen hydrolase family protein [Amycolatopsis sp. OK19-0408]|uniref:Carbon-nitrogen hydrolase family protein n=1 Tax=Amycolatopsis iheyensis TaxID=2945988 RepID=A0A9X2SPR7_9PSEU|nr:carbon-nitrogen hydrolase family protein [Amycolatopsis iheyensis]MCR6490462.1 carbon-nitrogen hydrolase family protein [Amycolatopsis iheyensis]